MFHDLVKSARTIRRFDESDRISEETLRTLVDMARVTPSGGNLQPLRYRLISSAEECALVFPHTAWAGALKEWDGPAEGERPTGYIAILSDATRESSPSADMGIAAQTIQLGATDLGYGACMIGSIQRVKIQEALRVPEAWKVLLLVALGKPAEKAVLEEMAPGASTDYYRTEDDVHHVPKRTLDEVLVQ